MRWIVTGVLCVSLLLLILVVFKKRLGLGWLSVFGSHLAMSAIAIFIFNYSGLMDETYIPLNPMTIGTVMVFGLPGVALLLSLKLTLI